MWPPPFGFMSWEGVKELPSVRSLLDEALTGGGAPSGGGEEETSLTPRARPSPPVRTPRGRLRRVAPANADHGVLSPRPGAIGSPRRKLRAFVEAKDVAGGAHDHVGATATPPGRLPWAPGSQAARPLAQASAAQGTLPPIFVSAHKNPPLHLYRAFCLRTVEHAQQTIHMRLRNIVDDFPALAELHPFFLHLLATFVQGAPSSSGGGSGGGDEDELHSAGKLYSDTVERLVRLRLIVDQAGVRFLRIIRDCESLQVCKDMRSKAIGRMCTLLKRETSTIVLLEQIRRYLASFSFIRPRTRMLILCGAAGAGKRQLLNKLTRDVAAISDVTFGERGPSLSLGGMTFKGTDWQVVSAGADLLDEESMRKRGTVGALRQLDASFIFLIDLSESCGMSLAKQVAMFKRLRAAFNEKPFNVALAKADVRRREQLPAEQKTLLLQLEEEMRTKFESLSCETNEGFVPLRERACGPLSAELAHFRRKGTRLKLAAAHRLAEKSPDARHSSLTADELEDSIRAVVHGTKSAAVDHKYDADVEGDQIDPEIKDLVEQQDPYMVQGRKAGVQVARQASVGNAPAAGTAKVVTDMAGLVKVLKGQGGGGSGGGSDAAAASGEAPGAHVQRFARVSKSIAALRRVQKQVNAGLHEACSMQAMRRVEWLLREGVDPNGRNAEGKTPLMMACHARAYGCAQMMLDHPCKVNLVDNDLRTALHIACGLPFDDKSRGSTGGVEKDIIAYLIKYGAIVNAPDKTGAMPLHDAAKSSDIDVCRMLVEARADVCAVTEAGWAPIHFAASHGDPAICKYLVANGADVHALTRDRSSAVLLATWSGSAEAIKALVQSGARVNGANDRGWAPVHAAATRKSDDVLAVLLFCKADVRARTSDGETALHLAARHSSSVCAAALLAHGMRVRTIVDWVTSGEQTTALHEAVERGNVAIVRGLINAGAATDPVTRSGRTPLHVAVASGSHDIVQLLVDAGADAKARDGNGLAPIHLAGGAKATDGTPQTIRVLVAAGADANALDNDGKSALHQLCADDGSADAVSALIECGADLEIRDSTGRTALLLAAALGHGRSLAALLKGGANANAMLENGQTALHLVLAHENGTELLSHLLKAGGQAERLDESGTSALDVAKDLGNVECAKVLSRFVNSRRQMEQTAEDCERLHEAVRSGSVSEVHVLLGEGADPNCIVEGVMPLHVACLNAHSDVVALLLKRGALVDGRDVEDRTPLMCAAKARDASSVMQLLDKQADVTARDSRSRSALHAAVLGGSVATVQALLPPAVDLDVCHQLIFGEATLGETPLHTAAELGDGDVLAALLDVEKLPKLLDTRDAREWTALHRAASRCHTNCVALLIEKGSSVDAATATGEQALQLACRMGHFDTVAILLDKGASVNAYAQQGTGPLHEACERNNVKLAGLLLSRNANVFGESETKATVTPLHVAARFGSLDCVVLLTSKNANPLARDGAGNTPLHAACLRGDDTIVKALLDVGSDPSMTNALGEMALDIAEKHGHVSCAQMLRTRNVAFAEQMTPAERRRIGLSEALHRAVKEDDVRAIDLLVAQGADIRMTEVGGHSVMHLAARKGLVGMATKLLSKGAPLSTQDNLGRLPLHVAAEEGHADMIRLLIERGSDVYAVDTIGGTALHHAATAACAQTLLNRSAGLVNVSDTNASTAAHRAAALGRIDVLKVLVDAGADLNAADEKGWTVLHEGAHANQVLAVDFVISFGADVNALAGDGFTPLLLCMSANVSESTAVLIRHGADVNAAAPNGLWTPLHFAAFHGNLDMIRALGRASADLFAKNGDGLTPIAVADAFGQQAAAQLLATLAVSPIGEGGSGGGKRALGNIAELVRAVTAGDLDSVGLSIDDGFDPDTVDSQGTGMLHVAARRGNEAMITLLLVRNASIELPMADGRTALHVAAEEGHAGVITLLLERGARTDTRDESGASALHVAAAHSDSCVVALLSGGALVDAVDDEGRTPTHVAASEGQAACLSRLLHAGQDANVVDDRGWSPLHYAANHNFRPCAVLLLDADADPNLMAADGTAPLHLATWCSRTDTALLLIEQGADVNAHGTAGYTALHEAASKGDMAMVKMLVSRNADANAVNDFHESALQLAARGGKTKVVNFLIKNHSKARHVDERGWSAVHEAAFGGHLETVALLHSKHGEINSPTLRGETPMDLAIQGGQSEVVQLLTQLGAMTGEQLGYDARGEDDDDDESLLVSTRMRTSIASRARAPSLSDSDYSPQPQPQPTPPEDPPITPVLSYRRNKPRRPSPLSFTGSDASRPAFQPSPLRQ